MKRFISLFVIALFIISSQVTFSEELANYLWRMEKEEDLEIIKDDGTDAILTLTKDHTKEGEFSLEITPSGTAVETKIVLDLTSKELINIWKKNKVVKVNIYIPDGLDVKHRFFFMGMADVGDGFQWIDGAMAEAEIEAGWNQIKYYTTEKMRKISAGGKYKVYLSFGKRGKGGVKVPLQEKFYIDGIYVGDDWAVARKNAMLNIPQETKDEVNALLKMNKNDLLDTIQKKTFNYFWNEVNLDIGIIKDRNTDYAPCNVAVVGFGMTAIAVGIERGWITKDEGYERVLITLKSFENGTIPGKNGFFYHWVEMKEGKRIWESEVSTIDTALFIAGALFAGEYFKGTEIEKLADKIYNKVNWQWMMNNGDSLSMGWKPESGFLKARWNGFDESILATFLAIASPTYHIPVEAWDEIYRQINDDHICLTQETLFVYQYPQCWIDFRDKEDKYANYFNNLIVAIKYNRKFSMKRSKEYRSYERHIWGLSASDGPKGYRAYGAHDEHHDGTIAPYASVASLSHTPGLSLKAIKTMLKKHGQLIWGKYGFKSAFNVDLNWYSKDHIGIDQGDIILMIENYRTGMVWNYFMKNKYVIDGMKKIGFKDKKSKYALTPEYDKSIKEKYKGRW